MTKKNKKAIKKKKNRGTKLFILCVTLAFSISVIALGLLSTTRAALKDDDNQTNNFSYGDLRVDLVEEFEPGKDLEIGGDPYTKKVSVKNNGEVASFIRVLVLPEITPTVGADETPVLLPSAIGNELSLLDASGVPITDSEDWHNGGDGYYYYLKKLAPGNTTKELFHSVSVDANLLDINPKYEDATFDIHVKVEGIHTTKYAYRDGWWQGDTPNDPALLIIDSALSPLTH